MNLPPAAPTPVPMLARLTSPLAAIAVLVVFWGMLVATSWNKSLTWDEMVPPVAGYSYWKFNDYRLDPENGNLPQRLVGLPFLSDPFPSTELSSWRTPVQLEFAEAWMRQVGDVPGVLRRGRAANALLAVGLAAMVWYCSRRLFGPVGGMLSLLLCALNPTILANGSLMTSEIASALFFLAATWTWWELMHRVTPGRLVASALAASGLLLSKMSAGLLLPIALALLVARVVAGNPLEVAGGPRRWLLTSRGRQAAALIAAGLLQAVIAYAVLWAFYGFRYSAMAPDQPSVAGTASLWKGVLGDISLPEQIEALGLPGPTLKQAREIITERTAPVQGWSPASDRALAELKQNVLTPAQAALLDARIARPEPSTVARIIQFLAEHRVFPEAYLIGTLHVWRFAQMRPAFLDGEHYIHGKWWFFPYSFAVKTPLAFLALLVLAGVALWQWPRTSVRPPGRFARLGYDLLPLWLILGAYGVTALTTKLNIGHRHIIPLYPPLFVLAGAAALWLQAGLARTPGRWLSRAGWAAVGLLGVQTLETAWRFPDYLAYFNGILTPGRAYRHFVDSSLDWGQDLPGAKRYIDAHPSGRPYYLAYFGNGDPRTYGIEATFLPSNPDRFRAGSHPIVFKEVSAQRPAAEELQALAGQHPLHDYLGVVPQAEKWFAVFVRRRETWQLKAGTYLISATLIQPRYRDYEESVYQQLREATRPYLSPASPQEAAEGIRRFSLFQWRDILQGYEGIRQSRLTAFLRQYDPDDHIGHSILVYKVTDEDLARAFDGPAPIGVSYRNQTLGEARGNPLP